MTWIGISCCNLFERFGRNVTACERLPWSEGGSQAALRVARMQTSQEGSADRMVNI
jgi:hypothetical protein